MSGPYRDLRYVRLATGDLKQAAAFATDIVGLQEFAREEERAYFRSDARAYSLCFSAAETDAAVALTVARDEDLTAMAGRLRAEGFSVFEFDQAACAARKIKKGIATSAPNDVTVELVWRPLTSGWRYHGPRDAGITEISSVSLACTDIAANEDFWTRVLGGAVSDWAGDAAYVRIDGAHHRIALYPSARDGILGVDFAVESVNNVMQNHYFLQARQMPIVHGPGRQPASEKIFVATRGPGDVLFSYSTGMSEAEPERTPRQFPDTALSHCAWGSPTNEPEFSGA
ncbi:MAG: VOC family protein [Pseudomonadota bacterium]|nr:VOC family protein [Pseudomonadota bacterium]